MRQLFAEYGGPALAVKLNEKHNRSHLLWGTPEDSAGVQEWAACKMERAEDIVGLFASPSYFGCEGDDPITAWAFDTKRNPFGAMLKTIYGSDFGHWDLPDMRDAAAEAWELIEHGIITEDNFRNFVFVNPVKHKTDINPDFFKGTVVEAQVEKLLTETKG